MLLNIKMYFEEIYFDAKKKNSLPPEHHAITLRISK